MTAKRAESAEVLVCLMSEIKLYLRVTNPFVRKYKTKPFVGIKVIIITR